MSIPYTRTENEQGEPTYILHCGEYDGLVITEINGKTQVDVMNTFASADEVEEYATMMLGLSKAMRS